jgi:multidrug efflux system membrane fusion protein
MRSEKAARAAGGVKIELCSSRRFSYNFNPGAMKSQRKNCEAIQELKMAPRRVLVISTVVVAFAGVGAWWLEHAQPDGMVKAAVAPVPVTVAIASREDLPIYLSGLGVVQASFTVGIRPQVDGKLEEVLFKEGEHVRKGDVLAKIDPRLYQAALDNAKAQKAKDEAQVISARKDLERSRTLVNQFFETKQVVDQQQAKVDQVIAMVDGDRAAIETAQTNLDYTSIVAPSDGRMGVRLIDPGNIVHASDSSPIVTLTLTRPSAVIFTLPARSLDDVRAALANGPVEVTAFSQDNRRALGKGTLLLIDNMVDQASATMRMKAMFGNENEQLWPGDFVNARVSLKVLRGALTVPSAAIQTGPDGIFAWVVAKGDVVQVRPITSGPTTDGHTVITMGLTEDDRVVVSGQYKLRQNSKVALTLPNPAVDKQALAP